MGSTASHWVDNASYFYHVVKMIKVEQGKLMYFFPYQLICSGVYVCVYVQEIGLCVCRIVLAGACMCIWQPEATSGTISQVSPTLRFLVFIARVHVPWCTYGGQGMPCRS